VGPFKHGRSSEVPGKVFPYVEVLGQKDGDSKFQARGY